MDVESRARASGGTAAPAIYQMVARALRGRHPGGGTVIDVGCGNGYLYPFLQRRFDRYLGVDVVRYDALPSEIEFHQVDLETGRIPLPDDGADVVLAVETIEHVENPRALMRELVRLARPGGFVAITTPNQRCLKSLVNLVLRGEFIHFQDISYPAHLTALLEVDLLRIASENCLADVAVYFSLHTSISGTQWDVPLTIARRFPRALSENVLLVGRKQVEELSGP
ncbi:MAG: class I SAM-dependent methyltransferase [Candidatus Limnocylindrales bacterium]